MAILQVGCFVIVILMIILVIIGTILSKIDDKKIAENMRRIGWQSIKNPIEEVKEWVKIKLESDPERYTVFGEVREWYLLGSPVFRDRIFISNLWTKQDGNKIYFVLNISDHYSRGKGGHSANFTIIGMRASQMSLPYFTLFPKIEFPKEKGWLYAISETHDLNLSNKVDGSPINIGKTNDPRLWKSYHDPRLKPPLELPSILAEETPVRAIDLPITIDSSSFNERYELYGKETERIRQFFDNEKLTALESVPQTFVDAGGELIFVYIPEHKPKVEDFEKYINDGIAIITAISR